MKKATDNAQEFERHFGEVYAARWLELRQALLRDPRHEQLQNPFGAAYQDYSLDAASLKPVKHLAALPGQKIADLCASPGGKALASIFALKGEAEWHCNDLSPARIARLRAILHDCLPAAIIAKVRVSVGDASRWGMRFTGVFDRVLVDAPCSGERHLMASAQHLARWSVKGSRRLAMRQHALLCAGLDSLKPGGRMVYSTCSISPLENDAVVEKLLRSREGLFRVVPIHEAMGEATAQGWIVLPDVTGCGPIYFSVIEKTT